MSAPDIYERQKIDAHLDILAGGGFVMRTPIWLQQTLFEDDNVYCLDIEDNGSVHVIVNGWHADYWPKLWHDRAVEWCEWA